MSSAGRLRRRPCREYPAPLKKCLIECQSACDRILGPDDELLAAEVHLGKFQCAVIVRMQVDLGKQTRSGAQYLPFGTVELCQHGQILFVVLQRGVNCRRKR